MHPKHGENLTIFTTHFRYAHSEYNFVPRPGKGQLPKRQLFHQALSSDGNDETRWTPRTPLIVLYTGEPAVCSI